MKAQKNSRLWLNESGYRLKNTVTLFMMM